MRKLLFFIVFICALVGVMAFVLLYDSNKTSHKDEVVTEGRGNGESAEDSLKIIAKADSLVEFAESLMGRPYKFSGISKDGFDCSGFTWYVFNHFGIDISRTSRLQAKTGSEVSYHNARKGDLIIFTGTNPAVRHPGHVGIITEKNNEQISFIHSSSARRNSGVKISEVEGTGYKKRFITVRRVLENSREDKNSQTTVPAP